MADVLNAEPQGPAPHAVQGLAAQEVRPKSLSRQEKRRREASSETAKRRRNAGSEAVRVPSRRQAAEALANRLFGEHGSEHGDERSDEDRESDADAPEAKALNEAVSGYAPLARCLTRLEELRRKRRRRRSRRWLAEFAFRLTPPPPQGRPGTVRFVALSDTHRHHDLIELPPGEVLLYAGDFVGNYGRSSDLSLHLEEFLAWLLAQSRKFERVFFQAGNHETLLDDELGDVSPALEQLRRFRHIAPNVVYLQNEPANYRGIQLFGSPLTLSRVENEGKRYYSRAFERTQAQRMPIWAGLPEGLDVLMTHCPPFGHLSNREVGDKLLAARLDSMARPPRYHVFGHDHEGIGVEVTERTVFLNVAQDQLLHVDPKGGGCPLVFDVEPRDLDSGAG